MSSKCGQDFSRWHSQRALRLTLKEISKLKLAFRPQDLPRLERLAFLHVQTYAKVRYPKWARLAQARKAGKRATNSKLANGATSVELLGQHKNEADEFPASVQNTFMAIWTILQSQFKKGSPNNIGTTNLEYYCLGFLNYGCPFISSSGLVVQTFDHTRGSSEKYLEFDCTVAKENWHNSDDCRYRPIWCFCRVSTCVY